MGDTREQRTTTDTVVSLRSSFFTMSDLLDSRLTPQSPGEGRPAGSTQIREGGSTGASGTRLQFSRERV